MKILGRAGALGHPHLAMYPAFALYDGVSEVRRLAAEALGEIGTPASVVYLRSYFFLVPVGAQATEDDLREYNAARVALVAVTGHDDVPGAKEAWVAAADAAAVRDGWAEWFRTPPGVEVLLDGIRDLQRIGEIFPQRYLVDFMSEPSFEVAKASYQALLERSKGPPKGVTETALETKMWPRFPRVATSDVTPESLPGIRDAVTAWWGQYRALRQQ
jgi:hypothetical protein